MIYNYEKFLEKKINKIDLETIYNKYYSKLDRNVFEKIVSVDPTSLIDNILYMGRYSKWLVDLYIKNKLKLEDLYKATEYLELFDNQAVKNKIKRKNINNYNNLSDLAKELESFKDTEEILSKSELKDKNFIQEFNNFNLYIPRTYKDNCILGKGTEWCTATEKTDKYYKKYHKKGRELLIFINKEELKEKYQLHLRSKQFMDKFDNNANLTGWLENNKDIVEWLKINYSKEYKRYFEDGVIDLNYKDLTTLKDLNIPEIVEGAFRCYKNKLTSLEGAPKIVKGYFNCTGNNLTTLKGAPEIVEGDFYCYENELTSLEGAPEIVEGAFYCSYNKLTSLVGTPEKVEGGFSCNNNKLSSLLGAPKTVEGDFNCSHNNLTSLEGCLKVVEGNFNCSGNMLTSLEGAPEIVEGNFKCNNNKLTTLVGCPKIVEGNFYCAVNNLTSLEGAPEKVEGNFYCKNNNLTNVDIERLKQNCEIKGEIIWL